MDENLNRAIPRVRLRAFRAIDDPEASEKFFHGHEQVLTNIGVKKVTSSSSEWMSNPAAFVFIVESLEKTKVYGGVRIHVAGGTEPLPIEQATGHLDSGVYDWVKEYARFGLGEGCGLWNSREIAGYGIGSIFLSRAGVAISKIIGIKSLCALCAPYTVKLAENIGYQIDKVLGNKGTFYYPKIDLLATVMIMKDINSLSSASEESQKAIMELRAKKNVVRIEELRNKKIEIHYEIDIPNMDNWDLEATIKHALQKEYTPTNNENGLNIM
jgi:hypothetical protein